VDAVAQQGKSAPASTDAAPSRLVEIDTLRGIAAVMVMMFHYTTRYDVLSLHTSSPLFHVLT